VDDDMEQHWRGAILGAIDRASRLLGPEALERVLAAVRASRHRPALWDLF